MSHGSFKDIANSDFDVNVLEDALAGPNIDLTFPLPTDKNTYVDVEGNEEVSKSLGLILNAFKLFTGNPVEQLYESNEYHYSVNKHSDTFRKKFEDYMNDKLEHSDEKLNDIVTDLINQEMNMKLIKPSDYNKRFKEVKDYMVKYYKEENKKKMPTFKSHNFIRQAYITTTLLLRKMFPRGIWCSREDFSTMYKKYLDDPMSIVFLPSHQSHVDYIILHYLCVRFRMATPTVVAGENLNVAIVGSFLKNLGAIFIQRSFNNELYTERNLSNVVEFMLLNKINFEVFIEGTRSRDGKLLLPKYGILKTLTNIYIQQRYLENNKKFDLLFQPVSITYERVYETDGYLKELVGSDKKKESLFNMLSNAGELLTGDAEQPVIWRKNGFNDNSERKLSGKIFFKLGESFLLSSFIESNREFAQTVRTTPLNAIAESEASKVNLKRLGFKILHEVNRISFLPEVSIIGTALQVYYYDTRKEVFDIHELLPVLKLVAEILSKENQNSPTNLKILTALLALPDDDLIKIIKAQIIDFIRYVEVNDRNNLIKIINPLELLYYKNLSIHLIIHRCIVSFILLLLDGSNQSNFLSIKKVFFIITGFLKNEFLFDYDYNERNELSFILKDLVSQGILSVDRENDEDVYKVVDRRILEYFGNLATPFIESYLVLISNIFELTQKMAAEYSTKKASIPKDQIFDDNELRYPDTKGLLKYITNKGRKAPEQFHSLEAMNKQYLVSDIYYLSNLRVIQLFKNKEKTKAFVKIANERDLKILHQFLLQVLGKQVEKPLISNEANLNYVIDIIEKNFLRQLPSRESKL
ncbi:glycerol-3-phosphate acyltransferase [Scheffersomyces xylosifermentans]|uniref:glycerol-3-phosphate acyltransferase n=1 Tax=Scheffersomyces xylosifermentans TaxID=1304137 RepID=UPI00315CB310